MLKDWRTAPINAGLRATLAFLEKLTLTPSTVTSADVASVRAAGVAHQALEDAIQVCAVFNVIDRVADALQFTVLSPEMFARGADMLLKRGYQ